MEAELLDLSAALWANANENMHDKALQVRFFIRPRQDMQATNREGRPIFNDVEYVSISAPGDRLSTVERPATRKDKARFKEHYAAFLDGKREAVSGTPLEKWPLMTGSQVEELKFFKIRTVEQLALMPDGNLPNIGNISHLKKMATDFLALAKGQAPLTQLRSELEKRDQAIEVMRQQMAEQSAMLTQLLAKKTEEAPTEAAPVKKAGRPRKDVENAG